MGTLGRSIEGLNVKHAWMSIIVSAALLAGCSSQPTGVGSYITSDSDTAMMVQIASIEDGRVTGTVSMVKSDKDGTTDAVARPFTGTLENKALNLSLENGRGLSLVTGILDGENLKLTFFGNGNSSQIAFIKKDAGEFDKLVGNTRVRSAEKQQEIEIAAAQKGRMEQRSKTQKSIDGLADRTLAKASELREKTKKLDLVIAGYQSAGSRIGKMQVAKRNLNANSDDAAYRASSIDYDIDGLSDDVAAMHGDVQSYAKNLSSFIAEASSSSASLFVECGADALLDCSRLREAMALVMTRNREFLGALTRENAAFNRHGGTRS